MAKVYNYYMCKKFSLKMKNKTAIDLGKVSEMLTYIV